MLEGLRLAENHCWPEALEAYEKASSARAGDPRLWYKKGVALTMLRRFEESLVCYDRAIQLDPAYTDAWFNKGSSLSLGFGRHQEAIQCFETAKRLGETGADKAIAICYQKLSNRTPPSPR